MLQNSSHAFETSLDHVLEVYLSLHRNDSTHPIPPLALSLSLQLKFTSSFEILKAAAQRGEGMSKFAYLRNGGDELDEYEEDEHENENGDEGEEEEEEARHDEYQDDDVAGDKQQDEGEDTFAEDHAGEQVSHLEEGQEYEEDEYPQNPEDNQEYDASQPHESHQENPDHEEYDEQHQTDPSAEQGNYADDNEFPEEGADEHDGHLLNEDALEHEADQLDVQTVPESEEHARPESPASSTTVHGDIVNDPTGEYYNEDFIDFGDDDLTAETAEMHGDDGGGNSAALDTEYDNEEAAADSADAGDATADDEAQQTSTAADETAGDKSEAALEHNLEGLDSHATHELHAEVAIDGTVQQEVQDEADNDTEQHGQHDDLPADDLDFNEEDLPAAHDEQLDTAFDLLEDHDFEQVAENGGNDEPSHPADGLEFEDDDIGFNDDVEEAVLASHSPLGKRSFDEHVGTDVVAEEQELKKVRS